MEYYNDIVSFNAVFELFIIVIFIHYSVRNIGMNIKLKCVTFVDFKEEITSRGHISECFALRLNVSWYFTNLDLWPLASLSSRRHGKVPQLQPDEPVGVVVVTHQRRQHQGR